MSFQGNYGEYLKAITDLLKENSTVSLSSIKDALQLPEEAISSAVDFLCEKSLIVKNGEKSISLTESGKEAIDNITMFRDYMMNFVDTDTSEKDNTSAVDMLNSENFAKIKNLIDRNNEK